MPTIVCEKCIICGCCARFCEHGAITLNDNDQYVIDQTLCENCGTCREYCPIDEAIVDEKNASLVRGTRVRSFSL